MNRIFKVIFNKTKGIFVVTGENAKAQGKSKHLKTIAASMMIASTLGMTGNVNAEAFYYDSTSNSMLSFTDLDGNHGIKELKNDNINYKVDSEGNIIFTPTLMSPISIKINMYCI